MTERERWIVYPLLFLALGAALRDKLFDMTTTKSIVCQELTVIDEEPVGCEPPRCSRGSAATNGLPADDAADGVSSSSTGRSKSNGAVSRDGSIAMRGAAVRRRHPQAFCSRRACGKRFSNRPQAWQSKNQRSTNPSRSPAAERRAGRQRSVPATEAKSPSERTSERAAAVTASGRHDAKIGTMHQGTFAERLPSAIRAARRSTMRCVDQQSARPASSAGIVIGLIVGLNVAGLWPSIPLHATATHGLDKFAIATGLVDDSVEALYFLDFLTGDMRAAVINPKTGKFNSFFTRNIAADFGGAGRSSGT